MDLIPRRWWSVLSACLVILSGTGLLTAWCWTTQHQTSAVNSTSIAPIIQSAELAGRTATWFASLLCLLGAMISLQIYLLRRHRGDDYRGYYTIWLWTAGGCLLASFNVAVGFHGVMLAAIWNQALGKELAAESWLFDLMLLIPFLALAGRLVWEMWESHAKWGLATSAMLSLGYIIPRFLPDLSQADESALAQATILGVTTGVIVSLLVFARFTLLDAHGLVKRRRDPQPAKREKSAEESTASEKPSRKRTRRVKSEATRPQPSEPQAPPTPTLKAHRPELDEEDEADSEMVGMQDSSESDSAQEAAGAADPQEMIHSLSSAKRKRPSKKQRRQQRRAA